LVTVALADGIPHLVGRLYLHQRVILGTRHHYVNAVPLAYGHLSAATMAHRPGISNNVMGEVHLWFSNPINGL
jgi:hypothetical protein